MGRWKLFRETLDPEKPRARPFALRCLFKINDVSKFVVIIVVRGDSEQQLQFWILTITLWRKTTSQLLATAMTGTIVKHEIKTSLSKSV